MNTGPDGECATSCSQDVCLASSCNCARKRASVSNLRIIFTEAINSNRTMFLLEPYRAVDEIKVLILACIDYRPLKLLSTANICFLICVAEGIREGCRGPARDYLESICMQLPEEQCLTAPETNETQCSDIEFDCGNGLCIPGLKVCDNGFDCHNGADELEWWVHRPYCWPANAQNTLALCEWPQS